MLIYNLFYMTEYKIGEHEKNLYKKIESFIEDKNIQLSQFWYSDRLCVTLQTFYEMMVRIGLIPIQQQMKKLQKQIQFISLQNVIQEVKQWKLSQKNISTYLLKGSPKRNLKQQLEQSPSIKSKSQLNWTNKSGMNKTQKFLVEHNQKQMQDKLKLTSTLRNVNNQSDYQIYVKIGQANDICTKLKNGCQYIVDTSKNGLQIVETLKGKKPSIISAKKFETTYKSLKLQIMNKTEDVEQGTLEQDLKKILVQVMCLSSDMRKQIKLLERKGIKH